MTRTLEGDSYRECPVCRKPMGLTAFRSGGVGPMFMHFIAKIQHGSKDHRDYALTHGYNWPVLRKNT